MCKLKVFNENKYINNNNKFFGMETEKSNVYSTNPDILKVAARSSISLKSSRSSSLFFKHNYEGSAQPVTIMAGFDGNISTSLCNNNNTHHIDTPVYILKDVTVKKSCTPTCKFPGLGNNKITTASENSTNDNNLRNLSSSVSNTNETRCDSHVRNNTIDDIIHRIKISDTPASHISSTITILSPPTHRTIASDINNCKLSKTIARDDNSLMTQLVKPSSFTSSAVCVETISPQVNISIKPDTAIAIKSCISLDGISISRIRKDIAKDSFRILFPIKSSNISNSASEEEYQSCVDNKNYAEVSVKNYNDHSITPFEENSNISKPCCIYNTEVGRTRCADVTSDVESNDCFRHSGNQFCRCIKNIPEACNSDHFSICTSLVRLYSFDNCSTSVEELFLQSQGITCSQSTSVGVIMKEISCKDASCSSDESNLERTEDTVGSTLECPREDSLSDIELETDMLEKVIRVIRSRSARSWIERYLKNYIDLFKHERDPTSQGRPSDEPKLWFDSFLDILSDFYLRCEKECHTTASSRRINSEPQDSIQNPEGQTRQISSIKSNRKVINDKEEEYLADIQKLRDVAFTTITAGEICSEQTSSCITLDYLGICNKPTVEEHPNNDTTFKQKEEEKETFTPISKPSIPSYSSLDIDSINYKLQNSCHEDDAASCTKFKLECSAEVTKTNSTKSLENNKNTNPFSFVVVSHKEFVDSVACIVKDCNTSSTVIEEENPTKVTISCNTEVLQIDKTPMGLCSCANEANCFVETDCVACAKISVHSMEESLKSCNLSTVYDADNSSNSTDQSVSGKSTNPCETVRIYIPMPLILQSGSTSDTSSEKMYQHIVSKPIRTVLPQTCECEDCSTWTEYLNDTECSSCTECSTCTERITGIDCDTATDRITCVDCDTTTDRITCVDCDTSTEHNTCTRCITCVDCDAQCVTYTASDTCTKGTTCTACDCTSCDTGTDRITCVDCDSSTEHNTCTKCITFVDCDAQCVTCTTSDTCTKGTTCTACDCTSCDTGTDRITCVDCDTSTEHNTCTKCITFVDCDAQCVTYTASDICTKGTTCTACDCTSCDIATDRIICIDCDTSTKLITCVDCDAQYCTLFPVDRHRGSPSVSTSVSNDTCCFKISCIQHRSTKDCTNNLSVKNQKFYKAHNQKKDSQI